MRVILIDDEPLMLDLLAKKLDTIPKINIIGKYTNPHQGLIEIIKEQPDAIF